MVNITANTMAITAMKTINLMNIYKNKPTKDKVIIFTKNKVGGGEKNTKCSIAPTESMRDNECIGKSQMDGSNISIL